VSPLRHRKKHKQTTPLPVLSSIKVKTAESKGNQGKLSEQTNVRPATQEVSSSQQQSNRSSSSNTWKTSRMIRQNSPSFEIHLLAYASLLSLFGSGIFIMVQAQMISNMNLSDTIIAVDASASSPSCRHDHVFPFDQSRHQRVYKVGVLAIRGFEAAYNEFNQTFGDYLTATAGQRFDPPVKFELKPLDFMSLFTDTAGGLVDFVYANPSAFSCIESEFTAHSLVSQVSRRNINGNIHLLNKFGGVIFARNDRDDIRTIEDIRDKIVAAASISGLGSGQMQFLAMQQAGMSYINGMFYFLFSYCNLRIDCMTPNICTF